MTKRLLESKITRYRLSGKPGEWKSIKDYFRKNNYKVGKDWNLVSNTVIDISFKADTVELQNIFKKYGTTEV